MKRHLQLTAILSLGTLSLAVGKWSRLPSSVSHSVNMSLVSAGTTVASAQGLAPSSGLILGDPLRPVRVASGQSEAILKLVRQSTVEKVSFVGEGLEGTITASLSSDGKTWKNKVSKSVNSIDHAIHLSLGVAQGIYVRLQFDLHRGGIIRSFQLLGSHSDASYKVTQTNDGHGAKVNFASGIGGGRLIYINPEDYSSRNLAATTSEISFPESNDKYRTAVYDLGQVRSLTEFGSVHSPRPMRIQVYTFETLPEKEDWKGRLAFDPSALDKVNPVVSGEDAVGKGVIQIKTKAAVKARYVAVRWEPDFNPPALVVSTISISGSGNIFYSSGGTNVNTTTDSDGNVTSVVNQNGNTMNITVNPNTGEVNTNGSLGADAPQSNNTQESSSDNGGAPPVIISNPSNTGNGIGSPESNGDDGRKEDGNGESPSEI